MRKKIIASILFLIVFITSTIAYAAIDAKVEINSSVTTIKPGEEVIFTVKVKDIVSENGANGIEGTISYDSNKFEELKAENVTKAGPWDVAYYNGKVIAEGLTAIKNDSDIIRVKLKVKDDSNLIGQTAGIYLNNVVVYNTDKVDLGTVSGSVKIEGEPTPTVEPTQKPEQTPTPTATVEPDDKDEPTPTPTATAKPDGGSESTPTPSTKPGETKPTPTPTTSAIPNNGVDKGDVPITNINTNTSSGSSTNNKGNNSSSSSNKGTTSSSSLPKAGIGSTIAVLTVVVAIIGTVSYIKLRKYNEI